MFTTRHAQVYFQVASPQTIRNWTREFAKYLSPGANPGSGNTRNFTIEDMGVLSLVAEMSGKGQGFEQIHASLAAGQRGDVPNLSTEDIDVLIAGEVERHLNTQLHETRQLAEQLQQDLDALKSQVQPLRDENIRLQVQVEDRDERLKELNEQFKETQNKIENLMREMGKAYHQGYIDGMKHADSDNE